MFIVIVAALRLASRIPEPLILADARGEGPGVGDLQVRCGDFLNRDFPCSGSFWVVALFRTISPLETKSYPGARQGKQTISVEKLTVWAFCMHVR